MKKFDDQSQDFVIIMFDRSSAGYNFYEAQNKCIGRNMSLPEIVDELTYLNIHDKLYGTIKSNVSGY